MSAEQTRIIEEQQRTIKALQRKLQKLGEIISEASENVYTASEIQSSGALKDALDTHRPLSISRFRYLEAVIIPTELLKGFER